MCSNAIFFEERFLITMNEHLREVYASFKHTFVKWNCNGSSVLKLTFNPTLKNSGNGFRSYVRNKELLLSGLMAMPICLR